MQTQRSIHIVILLTTLSATVRAQGTVAPCEPYWNAAAVFVGRVESVTRRGPSRTISFTVTESFRGASSSATEAELVLSRQDRCLTFAPKAEYLIYATRRADGGLVVDGCGRSRSIEDAGADLDYARAIRQGAAVPGYITGNVVVGQRTLAGKESGFVRSAPLLTVSLIKDGVLVAETKTSGGMGSYRLDAPGSGAYRVQFEIPEGFYSDQSSRDVVLPDARACAAVHGSLFDDGRLDGRVVDANGRGVAGLTLELDYVAAGAGRRTVTDRDGRYSLARIPAGRFTLSVPSEPSRDSRSRLYFPGVDVVASATRIALAEGERQRLADFRIPGHRSYVPVSGIVVDAGGAPAEGARVFLKDVGDSARIVAEPVNADFMGRFVISARAGREYGVFAERSRAGGRAGGIDASATLRVTATDGLTPMRLVLERR